MIRTFRTARPLVLAPLVLASVLAGCDGSIDDDSSNGDTAPPPDATVGGVVSGTVPGNDPGTEPVSEPGADPDAGTGNPAGPADDGVAGGNGAGTGGDNGGPGTAGGRVQDQALRLVRIATAGADGSDSRQALLLWDDAGRLLEERLGGRDVPAEVRRYTWGEQRRFERREDDLGDDGSVDRSADFTFGPDGRLAGARIVDTAGTTSESLSYSVGERGLVESLVREVDGTLTSREVYDHDAGGELQSVLIDSDGDGSTDRVRGYDYNADGIVTGTTLRSLLDDTVLERDTWVYQRGACITDWMNSALRPLCVSFR